MWGVKNAAVKSNGRDPDKNSVRRDAVRRHGVRSIRHAGAGEARPAHG